MAFMARNRGLSYCKVVEVIAETTAPLTPFGDLLTKLPSQRVDMYSPKEPDVVGGPDPASSKSVVSEAPSTPIEKEPAKAKAVATTPLSPYFAYDDLKPPTSPTPTPSSGQKDVNVTKSESKNASDAQTSTSGAATGIAGEKPALAEVQITRPLSPYSAYDDFKPPTSPSPIAPNSSPLLASSVDGGSQTAILSGNNRAQPPAAVKSSDKPHHTEPKPRPLSPFTMYEDLKPPASPVPSPRKY